MPGNSAVSRSRNRWYFAIGNRWPGRQWQDELGGVENLHPAIVSGRSAASF